MLDLFLKANAILCCKKARQSNSQRLHYLHLPGNQLDFADKLANFFLNCDFFLFGRAPRQVIS